MSQSLEIYDQMDWWNPRHSLLRMAPMKFIYFHEKIGSLEGLKILDIGCGGGLMAEEFARRGAVVTGIDLSEKALVIAGKHARASGLKIRYETGRAEALPCGSGDYDVVIGADCLEHVDDLKKAVGEVSRVLREGGVFCYDTINRNLFSRIIVVGIVDPILRREYKRLNVSTKAYSVHDWKRFIRPAELTALMAQKGLANRETKGIRFAGFHKGGFKSRVGGKPAIAYIGYAIKRG